MNNTKDRIK